MRVVALDGQREARDLARLPRLVDEIIWCSPEAAATAAEPLVVVGMLATEDPTLFRALMTRRTQLGLGTLVVPRFRPSPFGALLGAPEPIDVAPTELEMIELDGRSYCVPASVVFRTNLPSAAAHARSVLGTAILMYRPTNARGAVILCGAAVTGRRPGCDPEDQLALLDALLARLAPVNKPRHGAVELPTTLAPAELLAAEPEFGPTVLLAMLKPTLAHDAPTIVARASERLSVQLDAPRVEAVLGRLDQRAQAVEIERALREAGWGAFLRRLAMQASEPEIDA